MYRVILSPESRSHLKELRQYIGQNSSHRTADNYLRRLKKFYEGLALSPHRGSKRFKDHPGFRLIGFEHRISILFTVSDEEQKVVILGFYYGGRDV